MIGCEAAEYLAECGHEFAIVEMKPVITEDVMPENAVSATVDALSADLAIS